jgi:hypothetical protein
MARKPGVSTCNLTPKEDYPQDEFIWNGGSLDYPLYRRGGGLMARYNTFHVRDAGSIPVRRSYFHSTSGARQIQKFLQIRIFSIVMRRRIRILNR